MNSQGEWRFRLLNREERAWLHETQMRRDFPEDELKPLPLLERLAGRGINTVWGCFRGERLVGYYVLAQAPESPLLLDYLAVVPELRGTGCGTVILQRLRETLPEGQWLCIESERPEGLPAGAERRTRERRVAFYCRCGAVRMPVLARLFGVEYALLTLTRGPQPTAEEMEYGYRHLYQAMLGDSPYRDRLSELVQTAPDSAVGSVFRDFPKRTAGGDCQTGVFML